MIDNSAPFVPASDIPAPDAIERLAGFVVAGRDGDLPLAAVAAAKDLLLDSLGVGLAGSVDPHVERLAGAELALYGSPAKSGGGCRVLGRALRLPAPSAALLNSYQMHNSEYDCIHEKAVVHPMTVLLGAVLAYVDRAGVDRAGVDRSRAGAAGREHKIGGDALIRAIVLGVEVGCTLGIAASSGLRFFRPATAGLFAATAALPVLAAGGRDGGAGGSDAAGNEAEILKRAFGLAYAQLSGSMQAHAEGSALLALQMGFSARNALVANEMARRGMPGLDGVLEGRFGYFGAIESAGDIGAATGRLGAPWKITEVAHKPFPSGRATHGLIGAALALLREEGITRADILHVSARVPPLTHMLVGREITDNMEVSQARLNARFCLATVFQTGTIGLRDFSGQALQDRERLAFARGIDIGRDDNPDPNALSPVTLEVTLRDGRRIARTVSAVYGAPDNPMPETEKREKFLCNARYAAIPEERARQVMEMVAGLERVEDIRVLLSLLTPLPSPESPGA